MVYLSYRHLLWYTNYWYRSSFKNWLFIIFTHNTYDSSCSVITNSYHDDRSFNFCFFSMSFRSLRVFMVWFLMWTADVIPWVSWGTIAFITWIYDTLVTSLAHMNKTFLQLVFSRERKKARTYINGSFLVQLFSGILIAIIVLAKMMTYLLATYPIYVFAFFLWLIVASIFFIAWHINKRRVSTYMAVISWILIWYGATADTTMIAPWAPSIMWIFFAWAIASAAMILPWISGSYILVLLGKYAFILETLSTRIDTALVWIKTGNIWSIFNEQLWIICVFIAWVGVWLLWFSRVLHWLLTHHRSYTLAILVWCMIWALHIIWPWSVWMSGIDLWITSLLACAWGGIIYIMSRFSPTKKTTS